MSDWWAARLSGRQVAPQQPQGWQPQQQPQQQWVPQQQQWAPQQQQPQGPPKVTIHNLMESLSNWRGGDGARNSAQCPGCGGTNLFRRKVGASEAAPLCYDCGWNGIFEQVQPRV